MNSVFVIGPDIGVEKMFKKRGYYIEDNEETADAVVFTGGCDVYPYLYGERPCGEPGLYNFKRDLMEVRLFKTLPPSLPKIGICRGAQLFNVLCGGSLYQDCDGHLTGHHDVKDLVSGEIFKLNTIHHQMMIPAENAFLIACAREAKEKIRESEHITYTSVAREAWDDPEVIYYQNFNCLCYQGHPELDKEEGQEYFFGLVELYFQ